MEKTPLRRSKRGRPAEESPKEKEPTGKVVIDFSLVYKRNSTIENSRGPPGVKDLEETIFTKTQRIVDKDGVTIESQNIEETSWNTEEVEYLIVLRCKADKLFDQALKEKKLGRAWEKAASGLPKGSKTKKDAKQCQWMWYMLMKDYHNVLEGRKCEDEFPFFAQMGEARKFREKKDSTVAQK